jgi:(2S)-methylsuccinyl-CoA dehydrogenase
MEHLDLARAVTSALREVVDAASAELARRCERDGRISTGAMDEHQTAIYDLASVASALAAAEHLVVWGEKGELEAKLALLLAADVAADLRGRIAGREAAWGVGADVLAPQAEAIAAGRSLELASEVADAVLATGEAGKRHLPEDLEMVRQTFRRFAEERVVPVAEEVHRQDLDLPEEVITGLAELGCFALSIPTEYGGMSEGGEDELVNMVLVTEELSRGSLGVAGSLITRPEIIGTAILEGGTEEQKRTWLPAMAAGEKMCAVAVTEPNVGSDVAGVKVTATRDGDDWVLNGVKTWCTFGGRAEYLLVLARTDEDRSAGHRGLSLFVVEKDAFAGHAWRAEQPGGGSMDARAIPTLGYRGMHSFEVSFDAWRVPHSALIGEDDGLGKGFYLQMKGFASGRLQTAARAQGVMQSALDEAVAYTRSRHVFGQALADYELTRTKIARMAALLAGCRVFSLDVARQIARGEERGQLGASQVKQFACRVTEWVTREAQQLHGGYGYAEEYTVSRLFVDGRVLSIFEGADEVLALRVIGRTLLADALANVGS